MRRFKRWYFRCFYDYEMPEIERSRRYIIIRASIIAVIASGALVFGSIYFDVFSMVERALNRDGYDVHAEITWDYNSKKDMNTGLYLSLKSWEKLGENISNIGNGISVEALVNIYEEYNDNLILQQSSFHRLTIFRMNNGKVRPYTSELLADLHIKRRQVDDAIAKIIRENKEALEIALETDGRLHDYGIFIAACATIRSMSINTLSFCLRTNTILRAARAYSPIAWGLSGFRRNQFKLLSTRLTGWSIAFCGTQIRTASQASLLRNGGGLGIL